jgi:hypothetical protein
MKEPTNYSTSYYQAARGRSVEAISGSQGAFWPNIQATTSSSVAVRESDFGWQVFFSFPDRENPAPDGLPRDFSFDQTGMLGHELQVR